MPNKWIKAIYLFLALILSFIFLMSIKEDYKEHIRGQKQIDQIDKVVDTVGKIIKNRKEERKGN